MPPSSSPSPTPSASPASTALGVGSFRHVVAGLRVVSLGYAVAVAIDEHERFTHPVVVVLVLVAMALWTAITLLIRVRRNTLLLLADLTVAVATVLATRLAEPLSRVHGGSPTLPLVWVTGAVLAWALAWGWRGGAVAGLTVGVADIVERGAVTQQTLNGAVLLLLAGVLVGFTSVLSRQAEADVAAASRLAAAAQERTRLAAVVHDGVLQVLALVQRGGTSAALSAAAAEQEAALRALLARPGLTLEAGGEVNVLPLLEKVIGVLGGRAQLAAPLEPVRLARTAAEELSAAVGAALSNVDRHAGASARAWVLVDDDGEAVQVTVRDDGAGFAPGRLAAAETQGRLGVAAGVRGRLERLGGTASVTSGAGGGTVVELRVPR